MAHSRFSIPLFAVGLLAVAAYIIYWVSTKNIFGVTSLHHGNEVMQGSLVSDKSVSSTENVESVRDSFFDITKIKRVITSGAKKITGVQDVNDEGSTEVGAAKRGGAAAISETSKAATEVNSNIVTVSTSGTMSQRDYEVSALWKKYSVTIPRLYAHPRAENTEDILARVGQISMEFELGYKGQLESELIKIAVAGEREGARALSFQYMNSSLYNSTQALTWAMIANAITSNDYYLYICSVGFPSCTENMFLQAAMQAQKNISLYGFSRVQDVPSKTE